MDKLYLEFDEVFWDTSVDLFNYMQDDWTLIVNCYKLHTRKPILLMFNYGKQCLKYAKYTDEELVESAMAALKKIFPNAPSQVKSFIRTNWVDDKFAKGSYTYAAVGSNL
jgi:monoamine oxidase